MATIKHIFKGESLTVLLTFPEAYDMARIEKHEIYIGATAFTGVVSGKTVELKLTSEQTDVMYGKQEIRLWLDDAILGVKKPYCGDIIVSNSNAKPANDSTSSISDIIIPVVISETAITVGDILYNYVKGDKGAPFTYSDFTPEQIAELQQPAADAIASIETVELAVEQAEALRVQAEQSRQTNTATAIQNAETATDDANDAALLANEVANNPDKVVADYWHKWNTTTKAYENTGIKAKGDAGSGATVEQTVTNSPTNVPCGNAVSIEFDAIFKDNLLRNLIPNGNFSNGTIGWSTHTATIAPQTEGIKILASANWGGIRKTLTNIAPTGNILYLRMRVKSEVAGYVISFPVVRRPIASPDYQTISFQVAAISSMYIYIYDDRNADFTDIYIKEVMLLDLTAIFGAGKEPSQFEMDAMIDHYGWFESRLNLTNQKLIDLTDKFNSRLKLPQLLKNGNFANGIVDWTIQKVDIVSLVDNELTFIGKDGGWGEIFQTNLYTNLTDKVYVVAEVKADSNQVHLVYTATTIKAHSGSGNYEVLSGMANDFRIGISDKRSSGFTNISVKKFVVINLTATFGAGYEPSKEQMDIIFGMLPDTYYDGDYYINETLISYLQRYTALHGYSIGETPVTVKSVDDRVQTLEDVQKHSDSSYAVTRTLRAIDKKFFKGVHLDCGRKYFSPANIKTLIDEMYVAKLNALQLHFSENNGFRFGLNDMLVTSPVDGIVYDISTALGDGLNSDGTNKWLSQAEMDDIISYANSKDVEIIPAFDMPGHTGALSNKFPITILTETGKSFLLAILEKYVKYFASKGCAYFNICGDESGIDMEYYEPFMVRAMHVITDNYMTPLIYNDEVCRYGNMNPYINNGAIVMFWNNSNLNGATVQKIQNAGYRVINSNGGNYYWVLGHTTTNQTLVDSIRNSNPFLMADGTINTDIVGAFYHIWCDIANSDGADDGANVIAQTASCISAFGDAVRNSSDKAMKSVYRGTNYKAGACIFDVTLNKPVWWTGINWVDATGNIV